MRAPLRQLLFSEAGFTPTQIFTALQGIWAEPSTTQCFTDTAGTTPATAETNVAKINDKSGASRNIIQSTAASRPLLSARYNLLTKTEDFSDSAWQKLAVGLGSLPVVTNNYAAAPDGTTTAIRVQLNAGGTGSGDISTLSQVFTVSEKIYTHTFWVKSNDASSYVVNYVTSTSAASDVLSNFTVTPAWTKITITPTAPTTLPYIRFRLRGGTGSSQTADILLWHPDIRLASTPANVPPYQRVNTATDYDINGFPYYLRHDSNDSLVASLPALSGGNYSTTASVYIATPVGMSAIHNQSIGTSYTLPALSTDVYSWIVVPQRLTAAQESKLERYMLQRAGLPVPEYFEQVDYGPELVTQQNITGLPAGGGSQLYSTGASVTAGKWYSLMATVENYSGTSTVGFSTSAVMAASLGRSSNGSLSQIRQMLNSGTLSMYTLDTNTANFTAISVRELKDGISGYLTADDGNELILAQ